MDIYTYIAASNPYQAKSILHKYGYSAQNVRTESDLGQCLKKLVAYEGEDAMNDVLDSHPDKGIIIEKYHSENKSKELNFSGGCDCGCKGNRETVYHNFSGVEGMSKSAKETSVFILAAALLLAAAIIVKK